MPKAKTTISTNEENFIEWFNQNVRILTESERAELINRTTRFYRDASVIDSFIAELESVYFQFDEKTRAAIAAALALPDIN